MHPWIQRNLIYKPVRGIMGDRVWRLIPELTQTEGYSTEQLKGRTQQLLANLVQRAYSGSSFYRDRLSSAGYRPGQEIDTLFFSGIPILTKADVREYMQVRQMSSRKDKTATRSTSGSTGEPLLFAKDRIASHFMDAAMHQVYRWHGIEIGDREARFWGRPLRKSEQLKQRAKDWLLNRRRMSAFEMTDDNCERFWDKLQRFRPQYIYCYPNALYEFALYLRRNGYDGRPLKIKVIICTGEMMLPDHEMVFHEVFGCAVASEYGSTENGIIAFQCAAGSVHLLEQSIHLEIVDDDNRPVPAGEAGRILVTELHSSDVPFIRYELGDIGAIERKPCECGRHYSTLSILSGRIDSFIITPDGKKVYDAVLAYAFKGVFEKFFGRQTAVNKIEISYIPKPGISDRVFDELRSTLRDYVGADMNIGFERVASIPVSKSGKARYFESTISQK